MDLDSACIPSTSPPLNFERHLSEFDPEFLVSQELYAAKDNNDQNAYEGLRAHQLFLEELAKLEPHTDLGPRSRKLKEQKSESRSKASREKERGLACSGRYTPSSTAF